MLGTNLRQSLQTFFRGGFKRFCALNFICVLNDKTFPIRFILNYCCCFCKNLVFLCVYFQKSWRVVFWSKWKISSRRYFGLILSRIWFVLRNVMILIMFAFVQLYCCSFDRIQISSYKFPRICRSVAMVTNVHRWRSSNLCWLCQQGAF